MRKVVLGIGAHPDDLEILCGGTLAKFSKNGWKVIMSSVCKGDKSGKSKEKIPIEEIRKKEAINSSNVIEAESIILGFSDSEIFIGIELRKVIIDLIRETKPTVIITHCPSDYHSDHRIVSQEVTNSAYISSSKGFKTLNNPLPFIPIVYYMDSFLGINFIPLEYVDITDTIETKIEMIKKHKSQIKVIKKRGGVDIVKSAIDLAKIRGWQSGVKYAEGFQLCYLWPNLKTRRILP